MNRLQAGFARVDVTPMMGIGLAGYYVPRHAAAVLDALEINALALTAGQTQAILLSIDHGGLTTDVAAACRRHVSETTGIPFESVFLSATHTHTGPFLVKNSEDILEQEYYQLVYRKLADAARFALSDLKPANMEWGVGAAPGIAFIRRYRMKDGTVRTNPGIGNPDILEPLGKADERVSVLRFAREQGGDIVLVHFGNHPDTIGGSNISADWPGFLRRTVEKVIDGSKCIFFNGAQGDVNHINVHAKNGDWNGLCLGFDGVPRGYGHARHVGRAVAGAVLQVYGKLNGINVDSIRCLQQAVSIPSNLPKPEEMEQARLYHMLHEAGRDSEIPCSGMQLTTAVADAARKIRLEDGPRAFTIHLSAIAIGDIALLGIPGEPFTGIGLDLKKTAGWTLVLPCCNTNGKEGYFPMQSAYEEGGYEAKSSNFKAGVAERIIEGGGEMLAALRG